MTLDCVRCLTARRLLVPILTQSLAGSSAFFVFVFPTYSPYKSELNERLLSLCIGPVMNCLNPPFILRQAGWAAASLQPQSAGWALAEKAWMVYGSWFTFGQVVIASWPQTQFKFRLKHEITCKWTITLMKNINSILLSINFSGHLDVVGRLLFWKCQASSMILTCLTWRRCCWPKTGYSAFDKEVGAGAPRTGGRWE